MSAATSLFGDANKNLLDHFSRERGNDYDCIRVLLIYWKVGDDTGFKVEADQYETCFRDHFRYPV